MTQESRWVSGREGTTTPVGEGSQDRWNGVHTCGLVVSRYPSRHTPTLFPGTGNGGPRIDVETTRTR